MVTRAFLHGEFVGVGVVADAVGLGEVFGEVFGAVAAFYAGRGDQGVELDFFAWT